MTPTAPPPPPPPPGPWYVAPPPGRPLDGLSVAAFFCGLTCCGAPLAIGFGIAGLVRTRGGRRRGRWAAITGLVLGGLGTLVGLGLAVALVVGLVRTSTDDLDPAHAYAGECLDLDWADDPNATSCHSSHEGEIIWVGQMTPALMKKWDKTDYLDDFSLSLGLSTLAQEAVRDPDYGLAYWSDSLSGEPKAGDWMIVYVTAGHGTLHAPLKELIGSGTGA